MKKIIGLLLCILAVNHCLAQYTIIRINRQLDPDNVPNKISVSPYDVVSHTFLALVDANNNVMSTWGWGENDNLHGWSANTAVDTFAAQNAMQTGNYTAYFTGDWSVVDGFLNVGSDLATTGGDHPNLIAFFNCKTECDRLIYRIAAALGIPYVPFAGDFINNGANGYLSSQTYNFLWQHGLIYASTSAEMNRAFWESFEQYMQTDEWEP